MTIAVIITYRHSSNELNHFLEKHKQCFYDVGVDTLNHINLQFYKHKF